MLIQEKISYNLLENKLKASQSILKEVIDETDTPPLILRQRRPKIGWHRIPENKLNFLILLLNALYFIWFPNFLGILHLLVAASFLTEIFFDIFLSDLFDWLYVCSTLDRCQSLINSMRMKFETDEVDGWTDKICFTHMSELGLDKSSKDWEIKQTIEQTLHDIEFFLSNYKSK